MLVLLISSSFFHPSGVVIIEARYGRLNAGIGKYIDVSVPLQCAVDNSCLIITNGTSKSTYAFLLSAFTLFRFSRDILSSLSFQA
jgi:hypothetical protein